uniref:EB domain-containing protein n=1 Tax=Ditylenchus dipsaci TaxID=166011 RepID=A0A915EN41_9BILA
MATTLLLHTLPGRQCEEKRSHNELLDNQQRLLRCQPTINDDASTNLNAHAMGGYNQARASSNYNSQLFGSNFLSALRGYGTDTCRFVSCPFGQYCMNGVCTISAAAGLGTAGAGLGGYGGGLGLAGGGLFGSANKLCAETVDCYSGQICQGGRCTFTTGISGLGTAAYSGLGGYGTGLGSYGTGLGGYGLGNGLGTGLGYGGGLGDGAGMYSPYSSSSLISPYGSYTALASLIDRPSGVMMCTLIQDCANGQICVNGYCSQSNVAYGGSQAVKTPTTCATGAVCPVGQYCMIGVCVQNLMSSTTACSLGTLCSPGMQCLYGRCQPQCSMVKEEEKMRSFTGSVGNFQHPSKY